MDSPPPDPLERDAALMTPRFQPSVLVNVLQGNNICMIMNLCCFKPLTFRPFVIAAVGNGYEKNVSHGGH